MNDAMLLRAVQAIEQAESLTMACHIGPDGDALGSMLALAVAARAEGKEVWPTFGEPFELGETFSFLPLDLLVHPDEVPAEPVTMVAFDTGSPERLGQMAKNAHHAGTVIVIDHHVTHEGL